jgi:ketosteroid isomerase-like protein
MSAPRPKEAEMTVTTSPEAQESLDAALRWAESFNGGDVESIRATFSPEATWWLGGDLPVAGTYVGRDAVIDEFLAQGIALYEPGSLRFEVVNSVAQGDQVVLELEVTGKSAAGAEYRNHYAFVLSVAGGKVRAVREYLDTLYAHRVLWPAEAAPAGD